MKKNLLEIGNAVDVKIDGGVDNGVLIEKGVFTATIMVADEDTDLVNLVAVPYKNILSVNAE